VESVQDISKMSAEEILSFLMKKNPNVNIGDTAQKIKEDNILSLKTNISLAIGENMDILELLGSIQSIVIKKAVDNDGNESVQVDYFNNPTTTLLDSSKKYSVVNRWKIGNEYFTGRGLPNKTVVGIVEKHYAVDTATAIKMIQKSKDHQKHAEVMEYLDTTYGTEEFKAKK
jgi:hypothetical protein